MGHILGVTDLEVTEDRTVGRGTADFSRFLFEVVFLTDWCLEQAEDAHYPLRETDNLFTFLWDNEMIAGKTRRQLEIAKCV